MIEEYQKACEPPPPPAEKLIRDVAQPTPRLLKEHFAANPMTSDIGKGVLELALKSAA